MTVPISPCSAESEEETDAAELAAAAESPLKVEAYEPNPPTVVAEKEPAEEPSVERAEL